MTDGYRHAFTKVPRWLQDQLMHGAKLKRAHKQARWDAFVALRDQK